MSLDELVKFEEEKVHKQLVTRFIAEMIYIHYKHYKNEKFESYNQVYHSSMQFIHYSEKEQEEIYKNVDSILEEKYDLFFAHNEKDEPIYLVDISGKEDDVC